LRRERLFATIFHIRPEVEFKINFLNGRWRVDQGHSPQGPGRDGDPPGTPPPGSGDVPRDGWRPLPGADGEWRPLPAAADWMTGGDLDGSLAARDELPDPDLDFYLDPDLDFYLDPDHGAPPGTDGFPDDQELAGARDITGAGFAQGAPFDTAPGCAALAGFAGAAAGDDDGYRGVRDDELVGAIRAWNRVQAHAAARKYAAVAELIRRRPAEGARPQGQARLPREWDEFTADELADALAESRQRAGDVLELARDLAARLPGTAAALRSGTLSEYKALIIARACELLDPEQARAAEALVLGRAGKLTPGGLRAAIARAVMTVAPDKARKRREAAARDARVQRWAEDSGNAALAGRELPPAEALAADQRVTAWAMELRRSGLDGDMDELRARAFLDIMLGVDSRPSAAPASPPGAGPQPGVPAGFAARGNLTVPLATVTRLADRPGELGGFGPVDPWLARDLARAAAAHPSTTWCVTVTDAQGHAVGHGCARPASRSRGQRAGPGPPGGTGFCFTPAGRPGPAGGYGTWRLRTGAGGPDLIVALEPVAVDDCDHRHQARGHDPGTRLRHLTEVRHATCTAPGCRRPAARCDFDHNVPYDSGGRTCMCNGGPKCRHDHRRKQHPRWKAEQVTPGTFRWTAPSGRTYTTEPTRHPV
jgi:hypothetical protein